jgi:hypothetical protein
MTDAIGLDEDGLPVAYPAFSVCLHLEPLIPADRPRLAQANEIVTAAIGGELKHVWCSFVRGVERFSPALLDFIPWQSARLNVPEPHDNPLNVRIHQFMRGDFYVFAYAAGDPRAASPTSFKFMTEIPQADLGPSLRALSVLQVTLPEETWPSDLERLARDLVSVLRIRWGVAGYGYATRGFDDIVPEREAVYGHCRRFHGYDVSLFVREMTLFYDQLRTIGWLTFVGPSLASKLELPDAATVETETVGDSLLLRAGSEPLRIDVNRLEDATPYALVDRIARNVRASRADFGYPWSDITSAEWLDRLSLLRS